MSVLGGSEVYYFMIFYGDVLSGVFYIVLVYLVEEDVIYFVIIFFDFQYLFLIGSFDNLYVIFVDIDGDVVISLDSLLVIMCFEGMVFVFLNLNVYLL